MANDLRVKHDDKFLDFVRKRYGLKSHEYIEDCNKKMISALTSRIKLLLPYYLSVENECIVRRDGNSIYGSWKTEGRNVLDDSMLSDEEVDTIQDELCSQRDEAFDRLEELTIQLEEIREEMRLCKKNNKILEHDQLSPKEAAISNQCKAETKKYLKYKEALYDIRKRNTLFETFTEKEQELYKLLLEAISFQSDDAGDKNGFEIKRGNWNIIDKETRENIYELFSEVVSENPKKWKLSHDDMQLVQEKLMEEDSYDFLVLKSRLLNAGMPVSWMEVIEKDKVTRISNLKKMEKLLKKTKIICEAPVLTEEILLEMIENLMKSEKQEHRQ